MGCGIYDAVAQQLHRCVSIFLVFYFLFVILHILTAFFIFSSYNEQDPFGYKYMVYFKTFADDLNQQIITGFELNSDPESTCVGDFPMLEINGDKICIKLG